MNVVFNVFLTLCALLFVMNWVGLARAMLGATGSYSFAPPLLAGILACALLALHPDRDLNGYWALPLVLDPSIAFTLCGLLVQTVVRRLFRKRG